MTEEVRQKHVCRTRMADESDAGHASAMYVYCVVLCAIWGWGGGGGGVGGGGSHDQC